MKLLAVHPGPLMYTKIYLRLEPLGLELAAAAARRAGHGVRLLDLQVESHRDYFRLLKEWQPDVVAFSCNYLANVPEIVDLAKATKREAPRTVILVGGHSASFVAQEFLQHAEGAIDCVLKGEGDTALPILLEAVEHDRDALRRVPGIVTAEGQGPPPGSSRAWTTCPPRATCSATGANTSSACSIPARRSSSPADARGIVPSAAPGRFTAGATAP